MSSSRRVLPNKTYLLTRRTSQRFFLLRPDASRESQHLFLYCLAVAAQRHGVATHGAVQMSTHYHLLITDVRGVLPDFLHTLNFALAMGFKELRGWDEEVWNKSSTNAVELITAAAVVNELAYLIVNPVEAGAVRELERYPGVLTRPEQLGRLTFSVRRPRGCWFSSDVKWPERVSLQVSSVQALVDHYGDAEAARVAVRERVEQKTAQIRAERRAKGLGYFGPKRVCAAPIETRSTKREDKGSRRPTFAVGPGNAEAYRARVREEREWRARYAYCLQRWTSGDRTVVWPAGTWWMRVFHRAPCEPPPPG